MMQIQQDLSELRKSPVDLFDILIKIRDFYLTMDFESDNFMADIFEAKHILGSARIMVFGLINPYENPYVKEYEAGYKMLSKDSGRVDRYLDELEKDTLSKYDLSTPYQQSPKKHNESYFIINYVRKLDVLMEHLVYYPLKNSLLKFQKMILKNGREVEKDEDLFCYFIFVELFKSSQMLGNVMYEKQKTSGSFSSTSYENTSETTPDEIPKNAKIIDNKTEREEVIEAEEFFSDDIKDENETV